MRLNAPLYSALKEKTGSKRFHMPLHTGRNLDGALYSSSVFDFTELSFSDNLQNPLSVIREAERLAAISFNAKELLYFTSGATSAIQAGIKILTDKHEKVLLDSFSHKSVYNALRSFAKEFYILKRDYDKDGFPERIDINRLEQKLKETGATAFIATSPDYFGKASDIRAIKNACIKHKAELFLDASHGAHFSFHDSLPEPPAKYADIAALSLHKTIPVYTGGAALALSGSYSYEEAARARAYLATTSPSYVTLCSMDYARALYDEKGRELLAAVKEQTQQLKHEAGVECFFNNDDFTRLLYKGNLSPLEKEGIFCEMAEENFSLLLCSPYSDYKTLKKKLKSIQPYKGEKIFEYDRFDTPEKIVEVKGRGEFIELEEAEGRALADDIGAYPPGVPFFFRGERLDREKLDYLKRRKNALFNLVSGKICVIIE